MIFAVNSAITPPCSPSLVRCACIFHRNALFVLQTSRCTPLGRLTKPSAYFTYIFKITLNDIYPPAAPGDLPTVALPPVESPPPVFGFNEADLHLFNSMHYATLTDKTCKLVYLTTVEQSCLKHRSAATQHQAHISESLTAVTAARFAMKNAVGRASMAAQGRAPTLLQRHTARGHVQGGVRRPCNNSGSGKSCRSREYDAADATGRHRQPCSCPGRHRGGPGRHRS